MGEPRSASKDATCRRCGAALPPSRDSEIASILYRLGGWVVILSGLAWSWATSWTWGWDKGFPDPKPNPPSYWSYGGAWGGLICVVVGVAVLIVIYLRNRVSRCPKCGPGKDRGT